jgi:preprotein translocase subunit SecY
LESHQMLALISLYAPVVIIILAVVAVLFSFFWVFLPLPRKMSNVMGRLLIRFWRWCERRRRR